MTQQDVTEFVTAQGWEFPAGWSVTVGLDAAPYAGTNPLAISDAFLTDLDDGTPQDLRRHAFCRNCDAWIYQPMNKRGWETFTPHGAVCKSGPSHLPAEPLAIQWWREGRWAYVDVHVAVLDSTGRRWSHGTINQLPHGELPLVANESGTVVPTDNDASDPAQYLLAQLLARAALAAVLTAVLIVRRTLPLWSLSTHTQ